MASHFQIPFEEFVRTVEGQALIQKTMKKVGKHLPGFPDKFVGPDRLNLGVFSRRCRIEECESTRVLLVVDISDAPLSERGLMAYCERDHLQENDLRVVSAASRLLQIPRVAGDIPTI